MKRFAVSMLLLSPLFFAAALSAKAAPAPYKALVVKRLADPNQVAFSPKFLARFESRLRNTLKEEKLAALVTADAAAVPAADAEQSLLIEGQYQNAQQGNALVSGGVVVSLDIYALKSLTLLKTITVRGSFKGAYSDSENELAEIAADRVASEIKRELKTISLQAPTPAKTSAAKAMTEAAPAPRTAPQAVAPSAVRATEAAAPRSEQPVGAYALIRFSAEPDGAEISIDGEYAGNTPSQIKVKPGKHVFQLTKSGFQSWTRTLEVRAGESRTIAAELDKK